MTEPVDRKFTIRASCIEHGHAFDEFDSVLFLAKDRALPDTLRYYRDRCDALGAASRQLEGITLLIERVERWQAAHPDRVKIADVDTGPLGDSIIRPNEAA